MRARIKEQAKQAIYEYPNLVFKTPCELPDTDPHKKLTVEIGMGKGTFINQLASNRPNEDFIGIEVKEERCLSASKKCKASKLTNLRFLCNNFTNTQEEYKAIKADTIWVTFPDPWPKKRHHKRRLIHPNTLPTLHTMLKQKGTLLFKTDHDDLFKATCSYIIESPLFTLTQIILDLKNSSFPVQIQTEYEQKYEKEGIPTKLLVATRNKTN
jgi:tRNA (guanine-N7-)-methyltransferase